MRIFYVLLLLSTLAPAFSQEYVNSNIKTVTLFQRGAQIVREARTTVSSGSGTYIISGISDRLNNESLNIGLDNEDVTLVSVSLRKGTELNQGKKMILQVLQDSLELMQHAHDTEKNYAFVLDQELDLILKNKKLGGEKQTSVPEIEDALDLYRTYIPEIKRKQLLSGQRQKNIAKKIENLTSRIREFKKGSDEGKYEIVLTLNALAQTTCTIILTYYVADAGWSPQYDLRSKDVDSTLTLEFKAKIYQNTRELWNNVILILSGSTPNLNGNIPNLNKQVIDLEEPKIINGDITNYESVESADAVPDYRENMQYNRSPAQTYAPLVSIEVPYPVVLHSNEGSKVIELKKHQLNAHYEFLSIPKQNRDVFLTAKITEWEAMDLISGDVNIIFAGTYLGKSYLNTKTAEDTITLSLGRDKRISVERRAVKEFTTKNLRGSKIKEERMFEISLKNNKNTAITIHLYDQIPVSANKEITIQPLEIGNARLDELSGKLYWLIPLNPGESTTVKFSYRVTYPKNKYIKGLY